MNRPDSKSTVCAKEYSGESESEQEINIIRSIVIGITVCIVGGESMENV